MAPGAERLTSPLVNGHLLAPSFADAPPADLLLKAQAYPPAILSREVLAAVGRHEFKCATRARPITVGGALQIVHLGDRFSRASASVVARRWLTKVSGDDVTRGWKSGQGT